MQWIDHFFRQATEKAKKSKDLSTKVGCVLVDADKIEIVKGYNGIPRGVADLPERLERPAKYLWTCHAEENAIAQAARAGRSTKGATAYVTHYPCSRCARMMIQAGIARVVHGTAKTNMPAEEFEAAEIMFSEAGVSVEAFTGTVDQEARLIALADAVAAANAAYIGEPSPENAATVVHAVSAYNRARSEFDL